MKPPPLITLTTDFGTRDPYVAVMKGVIAGIAPHASIIDGTHDVPPFDVIHGAYVLRHLLPWFPSETIHVVVVDPGVGSDRRILAARYAGQWVLAPDNGVITMVHRDLPLEEAYVVENREYFLPRVSSTFHGRDVLAPAAAHLANGVKPARLGRRAERLELLPGDLRPRLDADGTLTGQVIYVDRFGNLITNISTADLHQGPRRDHEVFVNEESVGWVCSRYGQAAVGAPLALIGSGGHLEISVNQGSAAKRFGPKETLIIQAKPTRAPA